MSQDTLKAQLPHCLVRTELPTLASYTRYQGKVRDVYARGDRLILITTDRLSAFDRVLTTIPFKGELLNRLSNFWFEKTAHIVPNHVLDAPDPNVVVARKCEALPIEVVVRAYLTGSLWRDYQKGALAQHGLSLPPGLRKDVRFDQPILTPSTKAQAGAHDEPISEIELVSRGLVDARTWALVRDVALGLFAEGQRWAHSRGLILVDTKYEFGLQHGKLYVIDEMHTQDCSRYWVEQEYASRLGAGQDQRMLDKENIRQWLIRERGFEGHGEPPQIPDEVRVELAQTYVSAFERITGQGAALVAGDPLPRIERVVAKVA